MKLGYSLLLQEHVQASEVEYGDCAPFQITCPACREAVFKVESEVSGAKRHWLSHYRASKADNPDCELRVESTTREQIEAINAEGRGQQLRIFQARFRDAALRLNTNDAEQVSARAAAIDTMLRRPTFREYLRFHRDRLRRRPDLREGLWEKVEEQFADRSPFWRKRQTHFAREFLEHLAAPTSFANFGMAVGVGIILEGRTLQHMLEWPSPGTGAPAVTEAIFPVLREMCFGSDRALRQAFRDARKPHPPWYVGPGGLMPLVDNTVVAATMSVLVVMPYLDMLRDAFRQKDTPP